MHINDFYEYNLRPEDVPKNKFTGVIGEIKPEKKWIPKQNKFAKCPVLYFRNKDGSLNLTGWIITRPNLRDIADLYGPDMTKWPGKRITLYKHEGTFGGKKRTVFRVEKKVPPPPKSSKKKKKSEDEEKETAQEETTTQEEPPPAEEAPPPEHQDEPEQTQSNPPPEETAEPAAEDIDDGEGEDFEYDDVEEIEF